MKLLVVTDAFAAGRGVLVEPKFSLDFEPPKELRVRLKFPDGSERVVKASIDVAHMRGKLAPFAMVRLFEIGADEIPAGTEVWRED